MSAVLDIPYHGSEDEADVDSLRYVDAGMVDVASTPHIAWETHQTPTLVNAAAASFVRTTTMPFCSVLLLSLVVAQLVRRVVG